MRIFVVAALVGLTLNGPVAAISEELSAQQSPVEARPPVFGELPSLPSPAEPAVVRRPVWHPAPNSLGALIRRALEQHPQVRGARARLEAARHGQAAAEWGRYPAFAAEMSRTDRGEHVRRLQMQQPIWAGGRIDADIALNAAKVMAAEEAVRETELTLAEQMVMAAVDLAKARAQLARGRESIATYQKLFDAIERRAEGGLGLLSDVTLARSRVEQARATAAQFAANERRAAARWQSLTGFTAGNLPLPEETVADDGTLDQLVGEAKEYSPILARLRAEAEAAGFDAEVANAVIWPQLSLRAVRTWQPGSGDGSETQYLGVIEYQPGSGFGSVDRARAAYSQRESAIAQIDKAARELEEQVATAYADRAGFAARVGSLQAAASANADVIESFIRQYNIGKRSWLDVLNAQREWTDAILQAEDTRFNALSAAYRLAVLSGRYFRT